jgi:hypothetical protein
MMSNGVAVIVVDIFIACLVIGSYVSLAYYLFIGRALWPPIGRRWVGRRSEPVKYWMAIACWAACASVITVVNGRFLAADLVRFFGR